MVKILHISKYFSPYSGGLEDVCKSLVDGVPEFEQRVLCFNDGATDSMDVVDGVKVNRVGLWKEIARQPISSHFLKTMRHELKTYKPDIVHFHVPNPLVSLYLLMFLPRQTKLVVHWHSDIIVHGFIHFFVSPIEDMLLKRADSIIATSPNYIFGSKWLSKYKNKCHVIPNMVSATKMDRQPKSGITSEQLCKQYGDNIVLFVGRHVGYKGINYLIEAAKLMTKNEIVLIAGRGPETENLKALASGMDNVRFLGRIPDDELSVYMKAAKVFAFPSITKNEAFGVVLAEAMYCGTVPVTFSIEGSGVNWVSLADETGLEVPNRDVKAFAEAVDQLIDDTELRNKFSQAAIDRINKKFLMDSIHDRLLKIYNELIKK
jgi:glycosyltransferase involved in cell wall biosynthesis